MVHCNQLRGVLTIDGNMVMIQVPKVSVDLRLFILDCSIENCSTYYEFKLSFFYRVVRLFAIYRRI